MSAPAAYSILLAEDDESDVLLLKRALKTAEVTNPVHVAEDGQQAIDFLTTLRADPTQRMPALVLLDLKMPRRDGIQVLKWIRGQPILCCTPVVIFSSSANRNDVEGAYEAGANAYLIKPPSVAERTEVARFLKEWLRLVQPPVGSAESIQAAAQQRSI